MKIRPARPADLEGVLALLAGAGLPTAGVADHFASFWVAEEGGRPIGAVGLEPYPPHGLLRSAVVAPEARGRGVGDALVEALLAGAVPAGVERLWLLTETAQGWFARREFVPVPRERAPAALGASAELTGACPASAVLMTRAAPAVRGD